MKKWKLWTVVIIAVLVLVGGGYAVKQGLIAGSHSHSLTNKPQPQYVEKKHVKLVALGDSLTHGQGDEAQQGGYVGVIKQRIEHRYRKTSVTTVNYGVTGDRSDQILDRLNQQPQLRKDLKDADVITMTVGGNDLMQILEKNVLGSQSQVVKGVDQGEKVYKQKLTKLFTAVRKQNPHAPIFVMSIYNPFYTYFPDVGIINQSIDQWNKTTATTMKNYHKMYFVNIDRLMSYGQYQTKDQRQQLIQQEKKANQGKVSQARVIKIMNHKDKNLNEYISTEDNFHPNHSGYTKIANKLFQSMKKHDSWEFVRR